MLLLAAIRSRGSGIVNIIGRGCDIHADLAMPNYNYEPGALGMIGTKPGTGGNDILAAVLSPRHRRRGRHRDASCQRRGSRRDTNYDHRDCGRIQGFPADPD